MVRKVIEIVNTLLSPSIWGLGTKATISRARRRARPSGSLTRICTLNLGTQLRYTPIFDTCVFIDAVDDAIAWTKLCAARPASRVAPQLGYLSTAAAWLEQADGRGFLDSREALNKACELCKGKSWIRRSVLFGEESCSFSGTFPSKKFGIF